MYCGKAVDRSLPTDLLYARNSAVTLTHTVCRPSSEGPVEQWPSRKKPVPVPVPPTSAQQQASSVPSTLRAGATPSPSTGASMVTGRTWTGIATAAGRPRLFTTRAFVSVAATSSRARKPARGPILLTHTDEPIGVMGVPSRVRTDGPTPAARA